MIFSLHGEVGLVGKPTNHFGGQSTTENNSECVCLEWSGGGGVLQRQCYNVQIGASVAYREAGRSSWVADS